MKIESNRGRWVQSCSSCFEPFKLDASFLSFHIFFFLEIQNSDKTKQTERAKSTGQSFFPVKTSLFSYLLNFCCCFLFFFCLKILHRYQEDETFRCYLTHTHKQKHVRAIVPVCLLLFFCVSFLSSCVFFLKFLYNHQHTVKKWYVNTIFV